MVKLRVGALAKGETLLRTTKDRKLRIAIIAHILNLFFQIILLPDILLNVSGILAVSLMSIFWFLIYNQIKTLLITVNHEEHYELSFEVYPLQDS